MSYRAKEPFNGSSNVVKRFRTQVESLFIVNNGNSDLTFATDWFSFTLSPGEVFDEIVDPFDTLTITATSSYKGFVRDEVR